MVWKSCAMAVEYLEPMEHSFRSLHSVWNFINSIWTDPCWAEWCRQLQKAIEDGRTHIALLCSDLPQRDPSSLCPPVLFAMGVIPLHDLPEGAAAWTPASGNTSWLSGFVTKKGSWSASDPEGRQAAVESNWPTLPSASIAVSQGMDEGQHCLPLPGCSSIAQGEVLVPPNRKLAVKRCTRLQREENGVRESYLTHSPQCLWSHRSLQKHSALQKLTLLSSQQDGFACAVMNPWDSSASSMVKLMWEAV